MARHLREEKPRCSSLDGTCESHCLQRTHNAHGAGGSDHANVVGWKEHSEKPPREMGRGLLINFCSSGTRAGREVEGASPRRVPVRTAGCTTDRCLTVKGLQSNAQACVSSGLLPQTPPFRQETILRTGHSFPEGQGCFIDWPVKGHLADWLPRNGRGGQGWD